MFKVSAVHGSREWTGKYGPNVDYTIELEGLAGRHTLTQKPTTPAPTVGEELFGHAEDGGAFPSGDPKPPKFVKAKKDGGGFNSAPRPEDPKRAARILRQHSQDMALQYAVLRHQQGKLPDNFTLEDLLKIADKFDADAEAAAA